MKMTLAAFAALTLFSPALAQATQDTSAMDHAAMAPVAQGSGVMAAWSDRCAQLNSKPRPVRWRKSSRRRSPGFELPLAMPVTCGGDQDLALTG